MQAEMGWREKRAALQAAVDARDVAACLASARVLLAFGRAADVAFTATAFRKVTEALLAGQHRKLTAFFVRSVTLEPILPALQVQAVLHGYVLEPHVGGYGSFMEELLAPAETMRGLTPDLVCVALDLEEVAGNLPHLCAQGDPTAVEEELRVAVARMSQMLHSFRHSSKARLLVQGCIAPVWTSLGLVGEGNHAHGLVNTVLRLNSSLAELCQGTADCVFFDVDQVASQFGKQRWRDERMFLATRLPMAPPAFHVYATGLLRSASTMFRPARKVLCTDLDNTLWGGILGEDGPMGIGTGPAFPGNCFLAYQRYLKELSARGILLAITSKNNEADVQEAFQLRSADLGIGMDDFVAKKIGWGEKVQALRELSAELSLGLDSFVFVDDNPTECEAVWQHLPEVAVVQVPVDEPWRLVPMLAAEWYFDAVSVTADDRNRSQEYKAQAQRAAFSAGATSREEFLGSLGIVCTFLSAAEAPLDRSVQLLAKTNQFNLTTRRHSATEVMAFADDPACQAIAVRVRDRFGDAGVVGLALTRQREDTCWIDSLLLSCRVIGRGVESALLAHLAAQAAADGARWLVGEFLPTKKNAPCKDFYPEHGFTEDSTLPIDEGVAYRLDLAKSLLQNPSWLTLEGNEIDERRNSPVVVA